MSSFSVDVRKLNNAAQDEKNIVTKISLLEIRLRFVKNGLNVGRSAQNYAIQKSIEQIKEAIGNDRRILNVMSQATTNISSQYVATEQNILKETSEKGVSERAGDSLMDSVLSILWPYLVPAAATTAWLDLLFKNGATGNYWMTDWIQRRLNNTQSPWLGAFSFEAKDKDDHFSGKVDVKKHFVTDDKDPHGLNKLANKLKAFKNAHSTDKDAVKGYYDFANKKYVNVKDAKDGDPNKDTFSELNSLEKVANFYTVGTEVEGALWEKKDGGSYGIASGSYDVALGKAEAYADAYAGLFSYGEDGKRRFTPGVGAEVGASFSVFSAAAQGQIGDEYFNLYGKTSVEAGKVEAKGSVNVGFYDAEGKFNPQAKVGGSLEAIAAEASLSGGATIAGTSIGATGKVNVGVGAHANIGYSNGKISFDVGASLGVGVSVKLDIDMSGTIDAVSNAVGNAVGAVASRASSAWNRFKKIF